MCRDLVLCQFSQLGKQLHLFVSEIETFCFFTIVFPIGLAAILDVLNDNNLGTKCKHVFFSPSVP